MCIRDRVTALKKLGFDGVFDTNFAADITIMEEATEDVYKRQVKRRSESSELKPR